MRRRVIVIVAPLALAAAAIGLVWWSPWSSAADPVAHARAAFGNRPVVHVIARTGIPPGAAPTRPVVDETQWEIWLDRSRQVLHVVERRGGKLVSDVLGARFPQAIDPALNDFVSNFEADLAGGQLRAGGSGTIQGRRALWLQSSLMRVAIDPASYQALWVRRIAAGEPAGQLVQIVTAETLPLAAGDFQTRRTKKPRHL
jgi:hypothetical protein